MDVSVIVCTLNEEKRIRNCLEHLRRQSFDGSYEIILADGNSPDRTIEIARPLVDQIVVETIRRISAERQAGARIAQGDILAFTDADSSAPENWLENGLKPFRDERVVAVYGAVYFSDASPAEDRVARWTMPAFQSLFEFIGLSNPIGSNLFIRKSAMEAIGGFNTQLVTCEDLDLIKRAKTKGKIVYAPQTEMRVSARRIQKWGYLYYVYFHIGNAIRYHVFKKPKRVYEDIR